MSTHREPSEQAAEALRTIERSRVRALVQRNIALAASWHAPDFQLVTPVGMTLFRDQYLGAIESGHLVYRRWDPQDIEVRLHHHVAALRYRSIMQVSFGPHRVPEAEYWHTDLYEQRHAVWQIVWSQATTIQPRP